MIKKTPANNLQAAKQRLEESEENFRILFDENPLPTILSEIPSGKIAFVNKRLAALMGMEPGAIVGKTAVELGILEKPGDLRKLTDLIMARGYIDNFEVERDFPGGRRSNDLVSMRLITLAGKQFCLTVSQDISDRIQMETALRESESRFRKIIEQAPIAMAIVSMDGVIEYINEKAVKVFGYLPEDIPTMERWWTQAYPDETYRKEVVADWMGRIQSALATGGEIAGNEYRVTCKDRTEKVMFISGVPVAGKIFVLFDDITQRKQAEESLKRSEARYRHLVETTDTGYVIVDEKGCVLDANQEYVRLSGHENPEEIFGKCVMEWTAADDKAKNAAAVAECLKTGGIRNLEIAYVDKTGKRTTVEINATLIEAEGKQNILSLCRDITTRTLTEEVLRLRESYLSAIIENQPGLLWMKDRDGRFLAVNTKFAHSCGLDNPDSLVGKTDFDIWPQELAAGYVADDNSVIQSGTPCTVEEQISDKGENSWFETFKAPILDKKGKILGTTGFSRDITERKRLDAALRESEKRHKIISELASDYAYRLRVAGDGKITMDFISENFYSITGRSREDVMTVESWGRIIHPEDIGKIQRLLQKLLAGPQTAELECRSYIHGTQLRWVNVIARSEWDLRENRVTTIVGAVKDITERKRVEEELQKTQKLESLGVLAGGIAHDFNNLLTGIFGYLDLARSISTEAQVTEYLEATLSSMNRARALTLQLLTFAKGGAPVLKTTSLLPFINESVRFALSGSNISCRFSLADDLWSCNIDKNQIGQVIDNIVINAQQAMPNGGSIEITAMNMSLAGNEYPLLTRGDYVRISIKDHGIGIPKDILPRIFDPFYTTKTKGHGLGLATCYSIIKRHSGCIEVESEPGNGSTFHIFLPASGGIAAVTEAAAVKYKGSGTIVVMDDEEAIRTTVKKMLELQGYTVECKKNGREAVDFYIEETRTNHPVVAMIFDLTIPGGMGGVEAVAEVRKADTKIPIFLASGYAENEAMKSPGKYGFTTSICKPFTIMELMEMLNKYLKK